ncbi:AMP-binding protein [Streptomyces sp. NPDC059766]|uniref:AMP-binding protein n=1 Tax=Streptomyces sp. NPDC059766 TaxID=3346940 RepID=UPI003669595A
MNLNDFLTRAAHAHGVRVAVELGDRQLTYAELHTLAGRTAAFLTARGVQAGDRIGLMLPNAVEFPVLHYGILRAGAVVVPMNPLLRQREIAHYVHDCDMTLLLAHQDAADEARRGAQGAATPIVPVAPGGLTDLLAGHPDATAETVVDGWLHNGELAGR